MTTVLGLTNGHDASVSVVSKGEPVVVLEKERYSRKKHDGGKLDELVDEALGLADKSLADVDYVAVVPPIWHEAEVDYDIVNHDALPRAVAEIGLSNLRIGKLVLPGAMVPHHLAHAAYAHLSSGRADGAVLTADAGGFFCDATISEWCDGKLNWLEPLPDFSVGSIWSAFAEVLFGSLFAAGKVMGLAALGRSDAYPSFSSVAGRVDGLGSAVPKAWDRLDELFPGFEQLDWRSPAAQNLSAALQRFTNDAVLEVTEGLRLQTSKTHLSMAGGLALNGYLNSHLSAESGFETFFFPNAPHDGGLSLGAALLVATSILGESPPRVPVSPYLGAFPNSLLEVGTDAEPLPAREVAVLLDSGRSVGSCIGRAELGPRALGHRSILMAPSSWTTPYLNTQVKRREVFRPVAPAVRRSDAGTFLDDPSSCNSLMTQIGKLAANAPSSLQSCGHIDGSVRAQVVDEGSWLHSVIDELEKLGRDPVVLNTSLNRRGEPLVNDGADAKELMYHLKLDALALQSNDGNYQVIRNHD